MHAPINRRARKGLWQIFGVPLLLGILTGIGLVAALVGDGFWDAASWIGLGIPIAVAVRFAVRWRRRVAREQ